MSDGPTAADTLGLLLRSREVKIELDGFTFTIMRPTASDAIRHCVAKSTIRELAYDVVCGWSGVKQSDIIKGGLADPVPFSHELFCAWADDHPEWWKPIHEKAMEAYDHHEVHRRDAVKKSKSG